MDHDLFLRYEYRLPEHLPTHDCGTDVLPDALPDDVLPDDDRVRGPSLERLPVGDLSRADEVGEGRAKDAKCLLLQVMPPPLTSKAQYSQCR